MKRLVCLIIALGFMFSVYGDTITVTVTAEEVKAVESIVEDAEVWLQNAWNGKANSCITKAILEATDKNPNKLSEQEKKDLIKNTVIKTRKEKDAE